MVCTVCAHNTRVINSRIQRRLNQVWRRRKCLTCHNVFTTIEEADYASIWIVKHTNGNLTPFSRDKVFLSLYESCKHRASAISDSASLTSTVITKIKPLAQNGMIHSETIAQSILVVLNRFDKAASTHYASFHNH